ncbi:hypothetical protein B0F90DRAFT_1619088, partial [Multifurca ochricompacta]
LSFEDTLRDLAILRTSGTDLAAILASTTTMPEPESTASSPVTVDVDVDVYTSVTRSYEFVQAARAAIKIKNRGEVEAQGERVNDVRSKLEEV